MSRVDRPFSLWEKVRMRAATKQIDPTPVITTKRCIEVWRYRKATINSRVAQRSHRSYAPELVCGVGGLIAGTSRCEGLWSARMESRPLGVALQVFERVQVLNAGKCETTRRGGTMVVDSRRWPLASNSKRFFKTHHVCRPFGPCLCYGSNSGGCATGKGCAGPSAFVARRNVGKTCQACSLHCL